MADKRMFAKSIIDSDAFLDMPVTSRLLYYDLSMRADDDGFVNAPRKIMRIVGASNDDINVLITKKFVLPFENGVIVIKHWRIHNYLRKDRYVETTYKEQKALLELDENGAYRFKNDAEASGIPTGNQPATTGIPLVDTGKNSIDKNRIEEEYKYSSLLGAQQVCSENDEEKPTQKSKSKPEIKQEPAVFQIPLNDGTMYDVTQSEINMFQSCYPAVDVPQEIRGIVAWNNSNPTKRKTRRGIKSHINSWLADKQNKPRGAYIYQQRYTQQSPKPANDNYDNDENPFKTKR